jgi:hypothetical protein
MTTERKEVELNQHYTEVTNSVISRIIFPVVFRNDKKQVNGIEAEQYIMWGKVRPIPYPNDIFGKAPHLDGEGSFCDIWYRAKPPNTSIYTDIAFCDIKYTQKPGNPKVHMSEYQLTYVPYILLLTQRDNNLSCSLWQSNTYPNIHKHPLPLAIASLEEHLNKRLSDVIKRDWYAFHKEKGKTGPIVNWVQTSQRIKAEQLAREEAALAYQKKRRLDPQTDFFHQVTSGTHKPPPKQAKIDTAPQTATRLLADWTPPSTTSISATPSRPKKLRRTGLTSRSQVGQGLYRPHPIFNIYL